MYLANELKYHLKLDYIQALFYLFLYRIMTSNELTEQTNNDKLNDSQMDDTEERKILENGEIADEEVISSNDQKICEQKNI